MTMMLDTNERRNHSDLPSGATLQEAVLFLDRLVEEPAFLASWLLPFLERAERAEDWYVARGHDAPDGSCSLQVFVWPPGTGTRIHDHSAWGAFRCALGCLLEDRYERLDDNSEPNHARLRRVWRRMWREEHGVSTVLPYEGGIHKMGNPGDEVAISVHIYGPRMSEVDGRDYDPSRDYVCDRQD
ncbi:MAG: cysteine dioxygenase [Rubrobacteraceae bacterium]